MYKLITGISLICLLFSCSMKNKVDTIVVNANVYTVDSIFSKAEAFAIENGIFKEVGTTEEILQKYSSSNIIDMEGAPIYPGLNDAHCHLSLLGLSLSAVDLRGAKSFEEIITRLESAYKENPSATYLYGEGWDQNLWKEKVFPSNERLNSLFPDIPVVLSRIDFHAILANNAAIKLAKIEERDGSHPEEEAILKEGKFSGIFLEKTGDRVKSTLPNPTKEEWRDIFLKAQTECFRYGLTSVCDAEEPLELIAIMEEMSKNRELLLRSDVWLHADKELFERDFTPIKSPTFNVTTLKLYIDGALGSRGALLIEPYSDSPKEKGIFIDDINTYKERCKWAYDNNLRVATHAIGDGANRVALESYAELLKGENNLRWRVEHAQIIDSADISLFKSNSIVPSIQPTHCTSDMLWADKRLGERIQSAYIYKTLLNSLGWIPSGTDFPIESINPIYTFFAAACRKNLDLIPEEGFQMDEALTREEALRSMTIWAAKSTFEEDVKGSIESGKYADFIVTDIDFYTADEKKIAATQVVGTYVAGINVFSKR